jgi:hypothetical protein
MTWSDLDWTLLDRHRERFLGAVQDGGPYWSSPEDLAAYDMTYGERIGWKWDAVLRELGMLSWTPPGGCILDWGCGSGIAGRRVISSFGPGAFGGLCLSDHSPEATSFAEDAARRAFPGLEVAQATPAFLHSPEPIGLLVVSHVLNELNESGREELRRLARRSAAVLWVEPGSRETSRALGAFRDDWLKDFRVVAPCTHNEPCPVLLPGNERDWCHFFAPPPSAIFMDSNWVKFGQRAGIDLRSLPYSFLALDRTWTGTPEGLSRILGRPEHFKPYARFLNCDASGLAELTLPRRANRELYRELEKAKGPLVYRWTRDGAKIQAGEALR